MPEQTLAAFPVQAMFFGLAAVFFDFTDVRSPHGDCIYVAGAIIAAMLLCTDPLWALIIGIASLALVWSVRGLSAPGGIAVTEIITRAVASVITVGLIAVADPMMSAGVPVATIAIPLVFLVFETGMQSLLNASDTQYAWHSIVRIMDGHQALLLMAKASIAALTVVLYGSMGAWALVPVAALLWLIRQSYLMLIEVRKMYRTTISVLVDFAEMPNSGRVGHSDRVAAIAEAIGSRCGLSGDELERLNFAALLHDVDRIAETRAPVESYGLASQIISGVDFLKKVVPVLEVVDGLRSESFSEPELICGYIVALASDIDSVMRPEVREAHAGRDTERAGQIVPQNISARVVNAAAVLGYPLPRID
ncbi:MAG: hypothetical protein FWE94_01745 [Coriobacteriia bacterium]|nr:hypothetical protein [Coriobacteriia bacterium]